MERPDIYESGSKNALYRSYSFWLAMLDATYQSIVQFFIPFYIFIFPSGNFEGESTIGIMTWGSIVTAGCLLATFLHLGNGFKCHYEKYEIRVKYQ